MRNDAEKVTRTCDACGGHGTVVVFDVDVHCDSCDGRGVVDDDSTDPANDVPGQVPLTLRAPWPAQTVAALNDYQAAGWFHPFTCPVFNHQADLVATADGWICPDCDYTQDWAWPFMAAPCPPGLAGMFLKRSAK